MGIMEHWMKLKYTAIISIVILSVYTYLPFFNGLGCDFKIEVNNSERFHYSSCHLGVMKSIFKNPETGKMLTYTGLFGKRGDDVFFIVFDKNVLQDGSISTSKVQHSNLIEGKIFFTGKQIQGGAFDYILMSSPFYQIYTVKRVGRLSIW